MTYLLDTNTVSELMRANPRSLSKLKEHSPQTVRIAQPVIAEISFGLKRLPRSKRTTLLESRWQLYKKELLPIAWNDDVSESFAIIKATLYKRGEPLEDIDIAIAAHAVAHDMCLVTNNTKHIKRIKGLILDDWS